MKPAAIVAGLTIVTLAWLMKRNSTDYCCPHCGWETDDDEPEC